MIRRKSDKCDLRVCRVPVTSILLIFQKKTHTDMRDIRDIRDMHDMRDMRNMRDMRDKRGPQRPT